MIVKKSNVKITKGYMRGIIPLFIFAIPIIIY